MTSVSARRASLRAGLSVSSFLAVAAVATSLVAGCGSAKLDANVSLGGAPTATVAQSAPPPAAPAPQALTVAGDATLEGDRIVIAKAIFYDVDKDTIRPESLPVLDNVATIVRAHPEIRQLIVEGHTDSQGNYQHNLALSEKRAQAVVRYLLTRGVTTPMQAPGYGATAPMCHDTSEMCLQQNRRVEFKIKR